MKIRVAGVLLLFFLLLPALYAQTTTEQSVDSNEGTTSTSATVVTETTSTSASVTSLRAPGWVHMVRLAGTAGPFAVLVLAWLIGGALHFRLVRREHEQFPVRRGTRAPQWVPMTVSGLLFLLPAILFVVFEIRTRAELRLAAGGVIDEWRPIAQHAWMTLALCLVLAVLPWLFARRADTVS